MLRQTLTASLLVVISLNSLAQKIQAPQQLDILRHMQERVHSFAPKNANNWLYEGLLVLHSIDPQNAYLDYASKYHSKTDKTIYGGASLPNRGQQLAALVQTLDTLRVNDTARPSFIQLYLNAVKTSTPLQTTDTAFFTYAIAWGIREGYLEKKQYMPLLNIYWEAITRHNPANEEELGAELLAGSELYQIATPPVANLDESKVPPYQETPIPLTTIKNWEDVQRPAILHLFEKNVYGRMPRNPIPVTCTTDAIETTATTIKKRITIHLSSTDTAMRLHVVLYLPKQKEKAPVFVGYSFTPNDVTDTSSQWPIKDIIARGYGVAVAWYWDIEPDRADGWQTGVRTRLSDALQIQPHEWSAMGAWAWGLSRMADALQDQPGVDTKKLIVIGHSRLGKAAIWAGVNDNRFALVVSNESGEGGAALGKRDYGETIAIINNKFPWWFSPNYKQFAVNTAAMPTDQFMLLSLVAPRPLYVASAIGDQWSDPKGEFLSATLAAPVYKLYHEKGIGTDTMPPLEHPVGEFIRYHIRNGKHDLTLYDWQQYMNFADLRLRHTPIP